VRARVSPNAHGRSEVYERKPLVRAAQRMRTHVGKQLRDARLARKLTQAQAAEAAGIHSVQLSRVERGATNVTITTLVALATAYGMHLRVSVEDASEDA
jgi:DNA-binding XRE family transcriptional regulator